MANGQWQRALFLEVFTDDECCIVDILGARALLVVLLGARRWGRLILRAVETKQRTTYNIAILLAELLGKLLNEGIVSLLGLGVVGCRARRDEARYKGHSADCSAHLA